MYLSYRYRGNRNDRIPFAVKDRRYCVERVVVGVECLGYGRCHDLTAEEVRKCEEFAHFTDEEVQQVIDTLRRFTEIIYHHSLRQQAHQECTGKNN